jgi:hypothetical protein
MTPEERELRESTRIVINGQEYHSLDEVPEHYRDLLRDDDGDGVPDVLEGASTSRMQVARVVRNGKTTYTCNGKQFERIEDLPPEARRFLENQTTPGAAQMKAAPAHPTQRPAQRPEPPGQSVAPLPGSSRLPALLAAVVAALLIGLLIAWMAGWI